MICVTPGLGFFLKMQLGLLYSLSLLLLVASGWWSLRMEGN